MANPLCIFKNKVKETFFFPWLENFQLLPSKCFPLTAFKYATPEVVNYGVENQYIKHRLMDRSLTQEGMVDYV